MDTRLAYCSALDREVRVYLRPVLYDEKDPANFDTPAVICLEHAEDCLGMRCPLFDVSADCRVQPFEAFRHRGR
jgi:hypothetical protein